MKERIYNTVVAILAAEQKTRMITAGDCEPLLEMELDERIEALTETVAKILDFQTLTNGGKV